MPRWFGGRKPPRDDPARRERSVAERDLDWRSYDAVAEDYERTLALHTARVAEDLFAAAEVGSGMRVLDIGTGTGLAVQVAARLVGPSGVAVGVDPSMRMALAGGRVRPDASIMAADVLDLPFRDHTFDVVVANLSMPYMRRLETAMFDLLRVLRPGGVFAASAWTGFEDEYSRTWRELVEASVGKEVLRGALKDEAPWAEMLAVKARFETALRDAGLRPVTVELRSYRFAMSREDYIVGHETEAMGRFVRAMLGPKLWAPFRERVRTTFAERYHEHLIDLRDALLAVGRKPMR